MLPKYEKNAAMCPIGHEKRLFKELVKLFDIKKIMGNKTLVGNYTHIYLYSIFAKLRKNLI